MLSTGINYALYVLLFISLASCSKSKQSDLIIKLQPKESLVLEMNAYSCFQVRTGINLRDKYVEPDFPGPVVMFNKMTLEWTKTTKLFIHSVQIKFRGAGIAGGSTTCNITPDLPALFEDSTVNSTALYDQGTFLGKGVVTSHPRCRVVCSLPLADPDFPDIAATGEVIVKASEVTNEGAENEKYFRIRSRFNVSVRPN